METGLQSETPHESFIFAIRSPITREKYLGRIANFVSYVGITEENIERIIILLYNTFSLHKKNH